MFTIIIIAEEAELHKQKIYTSGWLKISSTKLTGYMITGEKKTNKQTQHKKYLDLHLRRGKLETTLLFVSTALIY